jgi:pimeloyl-ACP methyl ester carboxylesterase
VPPPALPPHLDLPEVRHLVPSSGGATAVAYDWGGDGPPLVFAHATGLHSHTWIPTVLKLRDRYHCYGVDIRGQGDSIVADQTSFAWEGVGDDLVNALDLLGLLGRGDVHGVGHSQGGFAVIEAARRHPGTFAALFAYEPVIFPVPPGMLVASDNDNHMAVMARKRRDVFPSYQAAVDNFRGKGPFARIDEDVLLMYVYWGFEDQDDGTVRLKCRPQNEAALFSYSATHLFDQLDQVTCPVTAALGEFTQPNFLSSVPQVAERLPHGTLLQLPGRTHFGIFEGVDEMAEMVHDSFARAGA